MSPGTMIIAILPNTAILFMRMRPSVTFRHHTIFSSRTARAEGSSLRAEETRAGSAQFRRKQENGTVAARFDANNESASSVLNAALYNRFLLIDSSKIIMLPMKINIFVRIHVLLGDRSSTLNSLRFRQRVSLGPTVRRPNVSFSACCPKLAVPYIPRER